MWAMPEYLDWFLHRILNMQVKNTWYANEFHYGREHWKHLPHKIYTNKENTICQRLWLLMCHKWITQFMMLLIHLYNQYPKHFYPRKRVLFFKTTFLHLPDLQTIQSVTSAPDCYQTWNNGWWMYTNHKPRPPESCLPGVNYNQQCFVILPTLNFTSIF